MSVLDLQSLDPYTREMVDQIERGRVSDPEQTEEVSDRLIDYAQKQGMTDVYAYALFSKAYCLYILNDLSQSYYTFERALQPLQQTSQWDLVARTYCCLGSICSCQGNTPTAMDYYLRGMSVCEAYQNISVYTMISCNVGLLYQSFHDYKSADRYFQRCIEKVESAKKHAGDYEPLFSYDTVTTMYYNKASILLEMGNLTRAREILYKTEELGKNSKEESLTLSIKMLKTRLLYEIGKSEEALQYIQEIDAMRLPDMSIIDAFDDFIKYAEFLRIIDKREEFIRMISRMEETVKATGSLFLNRRLVQLKIDYYRENQQQREYLKETGVYYDLTMKMEKELEKNYRESLATRLTLEKEKRSKDELRKEAASLKFRSEYDALTGLRNRNKFSEISENRFADCLKKKKHLAIEILDVDYFKEYNDNYGHQKGDVVLMQVASAIRSLERHRGVYTGRYGGDEFVVLYVDRTYNEVAEFVNELKNSVERLNIDHGYSPIHSRITLSQGVFWGVPNEQSRFWDFLHAADQALYSVKKAGRNNFHISGDHA